MHHLLIIHIAGISLVKTDAKNVSNDTMHTILLWLLSKNQFPISSPGVKMFHPAQQHSYIAHIYERHVLMKTVIELLYTLHRAGTWLTVFGAAFISSTTCFALLCKSSSAGFQLQWVMVFQAKSSTAGPVLLHYCRMPSRKLQNK
jgi:hypothetical protein